MEYYLTLKRNALSSHEQVWRNLKCILLNERNQSEKSTHCMVSTVLHPGKGKIKEISKYYATDLMRFSLPIELRYGLASRRQDLVYEMFASFQWPSFSVPRSLLISLAIEQKFGDSQMSWRD